MHWNTLLDAGVFRYVNGTYEYAYAYVYVYGIQQKNKNTIKRRRS